MYYAQMRQYDVANGPDIRATLFVSGCTRRCKNCHNTEAQSFSYGQEWTPLSEALFLSYCANPQVKGITILGGEPFQQIKDDDLLNLLKKIKALIQKPIWIYSGYTYEELLENTMRFELLTYCDVLIDGPFIESLKDLRLQYRGSSNQRIIDLKSTFREKAIKEICV